MHDPVLHADHEDHHHDTGGTKQVGGMRHGVEKLHLDKVNIQQEDNIADVEIMVQPSSLSCKKIFRLAEII